MISVAIVEDHQVLIDALKLMLQSEHDLRFSGAANTLKEARPLLKVNQPDVLLLDIGLPDGDGLDLVSYVREASPGTKIVILTCLSNEPTLMRAIDSGVSGFVSKSGNLSELLSAIRQAAEGEIVMPPSLLIGILRRMPRNKTVVYEEEQVWEKLTQREQEVLNCLASGMSGDDIASELNIASLTVRTHVRNLMAKLGVHSRLEAVTFGLQRGLIQSMPTTQMR
jgi:DNA-binding NarL/FixJ family response regulator